MSDIFESDCQAIVNTVNCIGVMGGGLAAQFRQHYPDMYEAYRKDCEAGGVVLGKVDIWDNLDGKLVVNFPTMKFPGTRAMLGDIIDGLKDLRQVIESGGITSIAVPPLGCGIGRLDWTLVEALIKRYLGDLGIRVDIYPPDQDKYTLSPTVVC